MEERLIVHYLGGVWMDVGWAVVLVGVALLASHVILLGGRHRASGKAADTTPRLEREREWELVMRRARQELARAPRVEELQAAATMKIESAELAYNRLVRDCARLCDVPVAPTVELAPAPPRAAEEPAQERAPLAA